MLIVIYDWLQFNLSEPSRSLLRRNAEIWKSQYRSSEIPKTYFHIISLNVSFVQEFRSNSVSYADGSFGFSSIDPLKSVVNEKIEEGLRHILISQTYPAFFKAFFKLCFYIHQE